MYNSKKRRYKQYLEPEGLTKVSTRTKKRWQKEMKINAGEDYNEKLSLPPPGIQISNNEVKNKDIGNDNQNSILQILQVAPDLEDELCYNVNERYNDSETTANVNTDKTNDFASNYEEIMFPQSGLTKKDVLSMVYALTLRHGLTNAARNDIIELLKLCGNVVHDENFGTANYYMSKLFDPDDAALKFIFYCQNCKAQITEPISKKLFCEKTLKCSNSECQEINHISLKSDNYFIKIDIFDQLKSIIEKTGNLIKNTNDRDNTRADGNIRDIQDGSIYKDLKKNVSFDLTYNFNTDGAPIFNSSKCSMWPIQMHINELPPKLRFKYIILAGIWVGRKEPNVHLMNTFIGSFAEVTIQLLETGITSTNNELNEVVNYKLLPLSCVVDSVARPILQNRIQYNGYYGCSWCYHPGKYVGRQMKYPFQHESMSPDRTFESHMEDLNEVSEKNYSEIIRGVKGPTSLLHLPHFDLIWSVPPDYMHGVALGVVKQLWELWSTYTTENKHTYYIGRPKMIKIINNRLLKIRPPHEIHRLPRSILTDKAKWKASEWRSWLLFYSLPCLTGILKNEYLHHFSLLVKSVYSLLKDNITSSDLEEAQDNLLLFVKNAEVLYGESIMTFNLHSLIHLTTSVKKLGPLWTHSAFPFESGMFIIKKQVKGPVGVTQQIAKKIFNINTFLNNINNDSQTTDNCKIFVHNIFSRDKLLYVYKCNDVTFLGSGTLLSKNEMKIIFERSRANIEYQESRHSFSYKRCIYKNVLLHSLEYHRVKKTNDTVIETTDGRFVQIIKFIVHDNNNYLLASPFVSNVLICGEQEIYHIFESSVQKDQILLLPFNYFKSKCVFIETGKTDYISKLPNTFEVQ